MNWEALIRRAAVEFHVPPHRVWRLSLKEWRALAGPPGPAPLSRAEFDALAAGFPDLGRNATPSSS